MTGAGLVTPQVTTDGDEVLLLAPGFAVRFRGAHVETIDAEAHVRRT